MISWRFYQPVPLRDALDPTPEGRPGRAAGRIEPMPVNVSDSDKEVVVEAFLPGVRLEDVDVSGGDGVLVIRATHLVDERDYSHQEVYSRVYQRQLALPPDCQLEKSVAELENGVLVVRVPRLLPRKPEKIKIQVNRRQVSGQTIEARRGEGYSEVVQSRTVRRRKLPEPD